MFKNLAKPDETIIEHTKECLDVAKNLVSAFENEIEQKKLVRKISKSKQKKYLQELATIRKDGFATSENELIEGATSIAAPVWDISATILGTVGVYGPANRFTKKKIQLFKKQILSVSQRMSTVMGYSGP